MNLSIKLPEAQAQALRAVAERLGVRPEQLVEAAITDLVARRDPDFDKAAAHVLAKNAEFYERLR